MEFTNLLIMHVYIAYVGQTVRDMDTRYKEFCRYVKSNNPTYTNALQY